MSLFGSGDSQGTSVAAAEQTTGTHCERRVGWPEHLVAEVKTVAFTL